MADILRKLRHYDFPVVTEKALQHLATSLTQTEGSIPGLENEDVAEKLVEQFIFFESSSKAKYIKVGRKCLK